MLAQETNETMLTQKMKRNMQWCYKHTTQQRENYQQKKRRHIVGTQRKRSTMLSTRKRILKD